MERADLALWNKLLDTTLGLLAALDELLTSKHGLSALWYQVLATLESAPDGRLRLHELAAAIRLSQSGTTRLVDRLEKEGLVERSSCPGDRRVVYSSLSTAGKNALTTARPDWESFLETHFAVPLGADHQKTLALILEYLQPGDQRLTTCPKALASS
ncbi:MAG: MarR family transcriptional regulator [Spirochaetales bacterium]|nr:MarR family transcriptional regulator [Spirochaetales bacterium]